MRNKMKYDAYYIKILELLKIYILYITQERVYYEFIYFLSAIQ